MGDLLSRLQAEQRRSLENLLPSGRQAVLSRDRPFLAQL
jgi:hypothetical protein